MKIKENLYKVYPKLEEAVKREASKVGTNYTAFDASEKLTEEFCLSLETTISLIIEERGRVIT